MWNSGVELVGLEPPVDVSETYINPFSILHIIAISLFASYPIFLYLGIFIGRKIWGRKLKPL